MVLTRICFFFLFYRLSLQILARRNTPKNKNMSHLGCLMAKKKNEKPEWKLLCGEHQAKLG